MNLSTFCIHVCCIQQAVLRCHYDSSMTMYPFCAVGKKGKYFVPQSLEFLSSVLGFM